MTIGDLPLFAAVNTTRDRDIERLVPVAIELATKAGRHGVTIADLRITAVNRGLLTGEERGRRLSFLGVVMKKAGLRSTNEFRRSSIEKSHGNPHIVWVLPGATFGPGDTQGAA